MRVNCYVKGHDGGSNCKQCLSSHPTVPATEGAAIACEFCYEDTFNIMADNRIVCAHCGTERPVTPQAAPQPPADVGEIVRKHFKKPHFAGEPLYTNLEAWKFCEAAITDYAKPLVERNKELEKYYDDALDYIDRGKAAEARADSLQRELDELKEYEAEEAAFMAKHNVSYCTTFVDGWARVLDDHDSLAETLGRVRGATDQGLEDYRNNEPISVVMESLNSIAAALGPVAGEGKE